MPEEVARCYDQLATHFHLLFQDWGASIARQAAAVGPLLERECGPDRPLRILDCALGIGTQALGLAGRGHVVTACDLSAGAVARASSEAARRGLTLATFTADMRDLSVIPESDFDAVVCLDNALPHLEGDDELLAAARQIRAKLRPGGVFLASIRDYDRLVTERPVVHGPAFFRDQGRRRIVHQIWDWIDDRRYTFHIYITREAGDGWEAHHYAATYRCVFRDELSAILTEAGFEKVGWLLPAETGFFQPLVLAFMSN